MKHAFFRPALLSAALCLALPVTLSAQTAGTSPASPPMTGATGAPAGVGGAAATSPHGNAASGTAGASAAAPAASSGAAAAGDASPKAGAKAGQAALSKADRDFMHKAAGAGMYEVEVSRLAVERATHADVKAFAEMMVKDHTAANQELMTLAQARGVQLPQELPKDKRKVIDALKKAGNFDEAYVKTVGLKDHKADIALFEKAHRTTKDAELKNWTGEKLPTLQSHLKHAQGLHPDGKRMGGNGNSNSTSSKAMQGGGTGAQGGSSAPMAAPGAGGASPAASGSR